MKKHENDRYAFNEVRQGHGYKWEDEYHNQQTTGYIFDNLNTKTLDQAETPFEKIFVDEKIARRVKG